MNDKVCFPSKSKHLFSLVKHINSPNGISARKLSKEDEEQIVPCPHLHMTSGISECWQMVEECHTLPHDANLFSHKRDNSVYGVT